MKSHLLAFTTLVATLSLATPARTENLEHTQQLLATKQCSRCELSNAGLVFADLRNADLRGANLSGANLSRANLQGADLRGANLAAATLFGANLTGAKLDSANVSAVDFRGAYLTGVSFEGAVLDRAQFQGAIGLSPTILKAEDFYRWAMEDQQRKNYPAAIENLNQAVSRKPDFAEAYLSRSYARFQTGDLSGAIADSKQSEKIFTAQGNTNGAQAAQKVTKTLTAPLPEPKARGNVGDALLGVLGIALRFFLPF